MSNFEDKPNSVYNLTQTHIEDIIMKLREVQKNCWGKTILGIYVRTVWKMWSLNIEKTKATILLKHDIEAGCRILMKSYISEAFVLKTWVSVNTGGAKARDRTEQIKWAYRAQ